MNKYILTLILSLNLQHINADDYSWGEEFKAGDTISAEVFNQIFNTIQKLNRTVLDVDLVGTWNCDATTTRNSSGYTDKGSFYLLEDAQLNFISSGASTSMETPFNVTTSSPSPLKKENAAFTGTYQLYKNMLFIKQAGDSSSRIYAVDIVSDSRVELSFLETSATSFPASYSSFVVCDSTAVLSNPPTNMTISQNGSSVTIGWTDNSNDETGFKIYRRASSQTEYTVLTTTTANVTSYTDADVVSGTSYFYSIAAVNSNGDSRKSNPVNTTVDSTPPIVISTSPAANSTVSIDSRNLSIFFSENIRLTSDGGIVGFNVTYTRGSNSTNYQELNTDFGVYATDADIGSSFNITLAGSAECLKAGTTVSVIVDATYIEDMWGNSMTEDYAYSYNIGNTANISSSWSTCGQTEP